MFNFFKCNTNDGKNGKARLVLIFFGGVVGIFLLLIGNTGKKQEFTNSASTYDTSTDELVIYQSYLEGRIRDLCESVSGVQHVKVAVTLSGSFESVYATEWPNGEEQYVVLGSGSSASALYLTRSAPDIAGIGIVCTGGGNETVRRELISLLCATFDVSSHRIYVTEAG